MSEETKKCPFCGEEIKAVAVKCRFCNEMLNKNTAQNPSTYEKNGLDVLRDFSLAVGKGEFLAIVGANGQGKGKNGKNAEDMIKKIKKHITMHIKIGLF